MKWLRTKKYYQRCGQKHQNQLPMNCDFQWIEKCKLLKYSGLEMIVSGCWTRDVGTLDTRTSQPGLSSVSLRDIGSLRRKTM